jgi:uncharacterized membrane protein
MHTIRNIFGKRFSKNLTLAQEAPPEHHHGVNDNIETLLELRNRHNQNASSHQLSIERLTNIMGQPLFLYSLLVLSGGWVVMNSLPYLSNQKPFDAPPFFWLQGITSFISLVLTTMVLITQNRLAKITEQQAQLNVHINLLSERKVAKLIALVEELRHDLPIVRNRPDEEAAAMAQATNPIAVLTALEEAIREETAAVIVPKTE